jgi:hypothetical protein
MIAVYLPSRDYLYNILPIKDPRNRLQIHMGGSEWDYDVFAVDN